MGKVKSMNEYISTLALSQESVVLLKDLEDLIDQVVSSSPSPYRDGAFVALDTPQSEKSYGLGRLDNDAKRAFISVVIKDVTDTLDLPRDQWSVDDADLIFFGTVDEHVDDEGERYLIVLKAPENFYLEASLSDDEPYAIPLISHTIIEFNEWFPHSVSVFDQEDEDNTDYCIAISLPKPKWN